MAKLLSQRSGTGRRAGRQAQRQDHSVLSRLQLLLAQPGRDRAALGESATTLAILA